MKLQLGRMRQIAAALCAGVATTILAGCGGNPIVGKWAGTMTMLGQSANAEFEFKADGTETQTISAMGRSLLINSTYKTDNSALTQTIGSATVGGKPFTMPGVGTTQTEQYKIDGDTLTLTLPNVATPVVLKRQAQ